MTTRNDVLGGLPAPLPGETVNAYRERTRSLFDFMKLFRAMSDEDRAEFLKAMRVTAGEKPVPDGMVPVLVDRKFWFVAADELARLKASGHTVSEVPLPEPAE